MKTPYVLLLLLSIIWSHHAQAQDSVKAFRSIWGKENIHFNISVPIVNDIWMSLPGKRVREGGVLGLTVGSNLCYSDKNFFSMQAGGSFTVIYRGEFVAVDTISYHSPSSYFINVRNNHIWGRHDIGYGLVLSMNRDDHTYLVRSTNTDMSTTNTNIGLGGCFSGYVRIACFLYFGMLYQPQFYSLSELDFKYEHLLSLDLIIRLNMKKKNSNYIIGSSPAIH